MTTNLLELQEMFRNFNMGDVQKGARGESGKAAQLIALSELEHRLEQQKAYAAELQEQGTDDPPLVDQYLAASQQMMGQAPPAPPQMPQRMPPQQQGIGSIMPQSPMPQQMAQNAPPRMPPQMPTQMMASGGQVGTDLMRRTDIPNFAIIDYLMSKGMSREEAEAQSRSAFGGGQALNAGGSIQRYQEGGDVPGGDAMEYGATSQEELEEDEPGLISNAIEWAKENPATAAEYGLTGLLAIASLPLTGMVGAAGVAASAVARRVAAKQLGKKAMSLIRRMKPTARATKTVNRRQPSRTPNSLGDMADIRAEMIGKEASAVARRSAAQTGLGIMGAGMMLGGEEEAAPSMLEGDSPGQVPLGALPMQPTDGGLQIGDEVGVDLPDGDEDTEGRSLKEKFDDGKFGNVFQFMTRAGLELAAGKGDNIGQDIAQASMSGMDYLTEMRNMEREQDRQSAAVLIRADQGDRDQARLEIEQENAPYQRRLVAANTAAAGQRGRMNESSAISKANQMIEDLMDSGAMRPFEEKVGREGFPILAAQLATFLRQYDTPTEALKALYDTNGVEMPPSMSVLTEEEAQVDSILSGGA